MTLKLEMIFWPKQTHLFPDPFVSGSVVTTIADAPRDGNKRKDLQVSERLASRNLSAQDF